MPPVNRGEAFRKIFRLLTFLLAFSYNTIAAPHVCVCVSWHDLSCSKFVFCNLVETVTWKLCMTL
jgi:hypothetical protein